LQAVARADFDDLDVGGESHFSILS
jgi:hypothetical protein